jgi:hypothetical protein
MSDRKNPWGEAGSEPAAPPKSAPKTFKGRTVLEPKAKSQNVSARGGRTEARQATLARAAPARVQPTSPSAGVKQGQEMAELRRQLGKLEERVQLLEDRTAPTGLPPEVEGDPTKDSES